MKTFFFLFQMTILGQAVISAQQVSLKQPLSEKEYSSLDKQAKECFAYEASITFTFNTTDFCDNKSLKPDLPNNIKQINELKKNIRNNYRDASVYNNIGYTYKGMFMIEEANKYFNQAIGRFNSSKYHVKSGLYTSTGEIFDFFQQLKSCNEKLNGASKYITYEGNLELSAEYDNMGHVNVKGEFSAQNQYNNKLTFEFSSDQTFISIALKDLEVIADKYGDMKGIKK